MVTYPAAARSAAPAHERLLAAALQLFSGRGYPGATTRAIASAAGVSELTLFRHFGSKAGLFREVLTRHTFLPRLRGLVADIEGLPCGQALRAIAVRYLETLEARQDLVRIMLAQGHTYPAEVRAAHADFIAAMDATLAGFFAGLQRKGALRRFPAEVSSRAFLRMLFAYFTVEEIVMERKITREHRERVAGQFVDLFLNGAAPRARATARRRAS